MTHADLLLPSGVKRLFDCAIETVMIGVRRFRRGDANVTAAEALTLLRRLTRLLRFAFLLAATWQPPMTMTPARPCKRVAPTRARVALRRPVFRVFPAYKVRCVDPSAPKRAQPAVLARAVRDPFLWAQRTLDALRTALYDPMPRIRRIARLLPTRLMVIGWRPPKRPPPLRDYWEELIDLYREAWFALREYRTRMRAAA